MSEDRFLEQLRDDAGQLRYEPQDDAIWTRLPARIRERVQAHGSVTQLLAAWFRPIAASLTALALAALISATWLDRSSDPSALDSMTSSSMEISVGGDTFSVAD